MKNEKVDMYKKIGNSLKSDLLTRILINYKFSYAY